MTSEENAVRTLLHESDAPASRLDATDLLRRGRRSRQRRRIGRMAGVMAAVVAVAVPVAIVRAVSTGPDTPADEFATTTTVVHYQVAVQGALSCTEKRYDDSDLGTAPVVDPSGRNVVGLSRSAPFLNLWTDGERRRIAFPNAQLPWWPAAVTTGGAVLAREHESPSSFIWRDGDLTYLKTPDGYDESSGTFINERGDVLGVVGQKSSLPSSPGALVVWPAGRPDHPRILAREALQPLDIRDDGTVFAARNSTEGVAIVVYHPDGTRRQIDGPADLRAGFGPAFVRGEILYASVDFRVVRWNLRTGIIEIYDGLLAKNVAASSSGWFVAATDYTGSHLVLVAPDRTAFTLPYDGAVTWISADGSRVIGNSREKTVLAATCPR